MTSLSHNLFALALVLKEQNTAKGWQEFHVSCPVLKLQVCLQNVPGISNLLIGDTKDSLNRLEDYYRNPASFSVQWIVPTTPGYKGFYPNHQTPSSPWISQPNIFSSPFSFCSRELFEMMSVPKSQQKADGTDAVTLMELLIHKDNEVKKVLQLGQLRSTSCFLLFPLITRVNTLAILFTPAGQGRGIRGLWYIDLIPEKM